MASEIISTPDKYSSRRAGDAEPIRCPNCGRDTAVVRRDRRRLWPEITENLAPQHEAYTIESVYSCVICKRTMTVLAEFEPGDSQEREPVADACEQRHVPEVVKSDVGREATASR